jgi:hypothetical protein
VVVGSVPIPVLVRVRVMRRAHGVALDTTRDTDTAGRHVEPKPPKFRPAAEG